MAGHKVKIRSILMQDGGQGDGIMATNGLQALLELGIPVLSDDAVCFTRSIVEPLIRIMLPGLKVLNLSNSRHSPHPRYHIISKISWTTIFRNYFTKDFYVNFAERRRRASYGYKPEHWTRRLQQWLTDAKLASGTRWRRETPAYYGLKMWAPLAEAWSISEVDLLRGLYLSYQTISARLNSYVTCLPDSKKQNRIKQLAVFPGGKAFQFLPPTFLYNVISRLGFKHNHYTCYFAPDDQSINGYIDADLNCAVTHSIDDVLSVIVNAKVTVTGDSFISHIAQLLARQHIAIMSHDLPQHTIHPAASSIVIFEPMECCPCNYNTRHNTEVCPAGYIACNVFEKEDYIKSAINAIEKSLNVT